PTMGGYSLGDLTVGTETTTRGPASLATTVVDDRFFQTMRLPILSGRALAPGDDAQNVVVDEMFATRFWPAGDAGGSRDHLGSTGIAGKSDMTIVGVAAHVRTDRDSVSSASESFFPIYYMNTPGDRYVPLSFVARLGGGATAESLLAMVKSLAPGARVRVT